MLSLLSPAMPGSFKGALHAIYNATDYTSVVRRCVVGGDVCCRSLLAGTSVAAQKGLDSIPVDWIKQSTAGADILRLGVELAKM